MGRTSRKRSKLARRAVAASAALVLGAGGVTLVNVYASAGEGSDQPPSATQDAQSGPRMSTIDCPDVATSLQDVPEGAREAVDRELAALDTQITEAYRKFAEDPGAAQETVLGPLEEQRRGTLAAISGAIQQAGGQPPEGLDSNAPCTLRADEQPSDQGGTASPSEDPGQGEDGGQDGGQGEEPGEEPGNGGQAGNGPSPDDFVPIEDVEPNVAKVRNQRGASRGQFETKCGTNENGKFNPDNVIVAPGVSNGAHHMHDYVGNQATDAFSSDEDLANGRTTCRNQRDKSTYYWPVLRIQNGQEEEDAQADGGGNDQNVGEIQTPDQVTLKFVGNPTAKVVAMPRFLRIITGDAKAFTNGNANANASWSCTGFENRQLKDKYPLCPEGSKVVRTFKFQSCWDGANIDSANHRTHVAFAGADGRCPQGFRAIPQLVQRIVYDVPPEPNFAVDSFPEQLHKPVTDHGDFINVFADREMRRLVNCVNRGDRCR
ncbi:DUF1996 domain-containing protein [Streptomyces sp. N35]|uniref:DUF1996 domain-containing protein n=1 Tax=Streptomyces sp. N35 TaxID=2795730 RepID=UPI0018F3B135|nr:DUF1996 domain-containing protein [Streptomyces sp. N35]